MTEFFIIKVFLIYIGLNFSGQGTYAPDPFINCAECHAEYAQNKVNHPATESCDNCHQPNGKEHPNSGEKCFDLSQNAPDLCYNCHEAKNTKTTKHPPVDGGECLTCHSPHSTENKSLLADFPASNLCSMCHEISFEEKKSTHLPVKEGKCITCHDPHQSDFAKLLKKDSKDLCISCHRKTYNSEGKTIANIGFMIKTGNNVHGAIDGEGCVTCHKGHSSDYGNLLVDKFPSGNYSYGGKDAYALCFTCHDSQIMEIENTSDITGFRNGTKNLHFVHVGTTKSRTCTNCHNVHGSPNLHLINDEAGFGSVKVKLNYKVTENGGGCLPACHQELKYDRINAIAKEKIMTVEEKNALEAAKRAEQKAALQAELKRMEEDMAKAKEDDEQAKIAANDTIKENRTVAEETNQTVLNETGYTIKEENTGNESNNNTESSNSEVVNQENTNEKTLTEETEKTVVNENIEQVINNVEENVVKEEVESKIIVENKQELIVESETEVENNTKTEESNISNKNSNEEKQEGSNNEEENHINIEENKANVEVLKNEEELNEALVKYEKENNGKENQLNENKQTNLEEEEDEENEESEIIKLNSVKFEFDSTTFNRNFEKELNNVARVLLKNPKWKVEIQGHTDNVGSEWYNLALSYKRAKTAKILLMNRGIAEDRISTVGYGESKPLKSNDSEKGRLMNRRIEFKIIYN